MDIDDMWDDDEDRQQFCAPSFDAMPTVKIGDKLQCDIIIPVQHTISMVIETEVVAEHVNELLADKACRWRLVTPNEKAVLQLAAHETNNDN